MRISGDSLRGRTVIGADGRAIGEVTNILFDSEGWKVECLEVKLRREVGDELGVSHRMFQSATLEIPIRAVQSIGDAVVLSSSIEKLRELANPPAEPPQPAVH